MNLIGYRRSRDFINEKAMVNIRPEMAAPGTMNNILTVASILLSIQSDVGSVYFYT